ncbi:transketolase [Tetragenococcus halophilus]|uniref:Transketolase n=1 Tax=Tetragenococcus halophilus (strain DSM 20338 / JCM 20259 / NCIMB 9735 / NBRC 12172) TaxID=945021 RepID=A0AAN1SGA9_TETHN|nr:transketolase [Tetragenococcus halophilus]WJS81131.1 transketolase [Tetragenococcus halophilus]BAK94485.1 transketolase [Tetragenococcus halophilus NBRC 12172]GBD62262.1 transketolase [Tetragenococcus halophilus subsp. halophilus]GBD71413.1 transketolase [Tetragenococcus halophilus subsp. halophilus]GBD73087.1 transketolase [Tetragenococcus halophilus subsp. halophilus]
MSTNSKSEQLAINTLRTLAIDAVEKASSGHMGLPLGAAPMAYTLWNRHLNINTEDPRWFNRDRFVLSAGHGSMLLYGLLHLSGFNVSKKDLQEFRSFNSKTPGHPEWEQTEGVEVTTGPLGQGISMAVGMALAEKKLAATINEEQNQLIDHYTYVLCGDGDLMEGVSHEAISFAGHLQLGKLIVLYDSNQSSLDASLEQSFSDDIKKKFEAVHWQHLLVEDGQSIAAIDAAINQAKESNQPTVIEVRTTIGYGLPNIAGTSDAHSDPVGEENAKKAKQTLEWEYEEPFTIPDEAYETFSDLKTRGKQLEEEWEKNFSKLKQNNLEKAEILEYFIEQKLPENWSEMLGELSFDNEPLATRTASHKILNTLQTDIPQLIGGAADVSSSTKATIDNSAAITASNFSGKNIYFGVREFGMAAIANGLALHHFLPFVSTYFIFSDYMKPAIRLAALMGLPVTYVFSHDSIAVGKDGPTHQPVEQLAAFRSMPNLQVIRPADGNETAAAWKFALKQKTKPTMLVLERQATAPVTHSLDQAIEGVSHGGYIVSEVKDPVGILIASGSEVSLALEAQEALTKENIAVNVVSLPSWDLFEAQTKEYKEKVLPHNLTKRITVEMASKLGWREYAGSEGKILSVDSFGYSGDPEEVMEAFGFTVGNVVNKFKSL